MSAALKQVSSEEKAPQELKPASFVALGGTAESRALPKPDSVDIKEVVKQKYGEAALRVKSGGSSCCGAAAATSCCDPITTNLYDASQAGQIPEEALLASLGCGNPDCAGAAESRRDRPRPRLRRRHRRAALRAPRRPQRAKPTVST